MSKALRVFKNSFLFVLLVVFTCSGCVSAKENIVHVRSKESVCDLSHLGKNKYYYSGKYQNKLTKTTKKIGRR
jgi:hypothetical protein